MDDPSEMIMHFSQNPVSSASEYLLVFNMVMRIWGSNISE